MYLTILLFLLYCWGFGRGIGFLAREADDFLERNLMRVGIGFGIFLALGLVLNLIHVPLDWRIFLAASSTPILIIIYNHIRKKAKFSEALSNINFNLYSLLMLALFFISLYMYTSGAFAYPYLEDDDPWSHSLSVKYVAVEKTVFTKERLFHYLSPYPPTYNLLLGILHQTNDSIYWTMKFFNALVISLSIIFFFYFAKELTNSSRKALFATFVLFALPSFLSHFIWALALTMPLFFISFYAIERIKHDKKWWIVAAIVMTTTLTSSPSHSAYFALFFAVYFFIRSLIERRFLLYEFIAALSSIVLSLILWWLPMLRTFKLEGILGGIGYSRVEGIVGSTGTGDRIYKIADFIFAKNVNVINNPVGIGIVISLLVLICFAYLAIKFYRELKEHPIMVVAAFSTLSLLLTAFLFSTYTGQLWAPKEKIKISFVKFLAEQTLFLVIVLVVAFLIALLAVNSYKNKEFKEKYLIVILAWFIFSFYAVNAAPYTFKLSPFRAWMLLAIPVSLLAGEAIDAINKLAKSAVRSVAKSSIIVTGASIVVLVLIAYGVVATSFVQKYAVNTAQWPPGGFWTSNEELQGYIWFKENIPSGTKVFTFSNNALIIGFDKFVCHWCDDARELKTKGFNQTAEQNYDWLKKRQYHYLIIDGQTARKFGANETNRKLNDLVGSGLFSVSHSTQGFLLLSVA